MMDSLIDPEQGNSGLAFKKTPLSNGACQTIYTREGSILAECTSFEPTDLFDPQWALVDSINYFHIVAITFTVVFNLLQNIFSIFDVIEQYRINIGVAYALITADLMGTTIQNLWARSLKVIQIPRHLTFLQSALIETIEKELATLNRPHEKEKKSYKILEKEYKKSKSEYEDLKSCHADFLQQHPTLDQEYQTILQTFAEKEKPQFIKDLIILISPEEYAEVCAHFSPWQRNARKLYHLGYTPPENNFDKTLQLLSQQYSKVRLHLMRTTDTTAIHDLITHILPVNAPLNAYKILSYSLEYNTQKDTPATNLIIPALSLQRTLFSTQYYRKLYANKQLSALALTLVKQLPALLLIKIGPALSATLQGPATLSNILLKFGLSNQSNFYLRLLITLVGCAIGAFKAYVTFMIKTDIAEERFSYLFNLLRWPTLADICLMPSLLWNHSTRTLTSFWSDIACLFSCNETFAKKTLLLRSYTDPLPDRILSVIAPFGTAYFYAGFGFFFSGSGLLYITDTFSIPMPSEDNYTNPFFLAFRVYSCISQVALNAVFNQGWDVIKNSSERIEQKLKQIEKQIHWLQYPHLPRQILADGTRSAMSRCEWVMRSTGLHKMLVVNTRWENTISACILIDSFVFALSAMAGTSKADTVGKALVPALFSPIANSMPFIVGAGILASQIEYSWVLGGRDGEKIWQMIGQEYVPEFVKLYIGMKHSVLFPATGKTPEARQPLLETYGSEASSSNSGSSVPLTPSSHFA